MAGNNMPTTWRESMMAGLPEAKPTFRHETSFVPVSTIAKQFYCEEKVEQTFIHGEVPSEVKNMGTELHEEVLAMERIEREKLVEHIERDPHVAASFRLFAEVDSLRVVGVPDAVVFERSSPRWLIELKTTRGDYRRFYNDQLIQARIYGLLLERMGFDCYGLKLAVVRMHQAAELEPEEKKSMLGLITVSLAKGATEELERAYPLKFFVFPHDSDEAEKSVTWAKDYWLGTREAIPTRFVGKCRICEYNSVCPSSLYRSNNGFMDLGPDLNGSNQRKSAAGAP